MRRESSQAAAEGRYVDQARPATAMHSERYSAGAVDVDGPVGLCRCLSENADQVDDSIRSCDRTADACVVKNIGLDAPSSEESANFRFLAPHTSRRCWPPTLPRR